MGRLIKFEDTLLPPHGWASSCRSCAGALKAAGYSLLVEPIEIMKLPEQARPAVGIVRSTNMCIPQPRSLKPIMAPETGFSAHFSCSLVSASAISIRCLMWLLRHAHHDCNHSALDSVKLEGDSRLGRPSGTPIAEDGPAGPI